MNKADQFSFPNFYWRPWTANYHSCHVRVLLITSVWKVSNVGQRSTIPIFNLQAAAQIMTNDNRSLL